MSALTVELNYGQRQFSIAVEKVERQDLSITVHPDLSVTARAPQNVATEEIQRKLKRRVRWIGKQIRYFEQFMPGTPPRKYVSGETHYYLGRQYRLKIEKSELQRVRLLRGYFWVELPNPDDRELVRQLLSEWYFEHFKTLIEKRLQVYWPRFERWGADKPEIRYRDMSRSWGSCSAQGRITLNRALAKVPLECIDYVLVHELCHLLCPGHNEKFYRLLSRNLPDWQQRKEKLEINLK